MIYLWKTVILSIKHDDLPLKNGDLTIENGGSINIEGQNCWLNYETLGFNH